MKEYIEREKLLKYSYCAGTKPTHNNPYGDLREVVDVTDIENIPAADVVEVRHGYWIDKGWDGDFSWRIDGRGNCWHVHECSECKSQICGGPKTKWCSYCGAKMDRRTHDKINRKR